MEFVAVRKVVTCSLCNTKCRAHKLLDVLGAICEPCYTRYKQKQIEVFVDQMSLEIISFQPFEGSVARKVTGFRRRVESDVHNYSKPILAPPSNDEDVTGEEPAFSDDSPERLRRTSVAGSCFLELSPMLHFSETPTSEMKPEQSPGQSTPHEKPRRPNMRAIGHEMARIRAWMEYDQNIITDQRTEAENMSAEIASLKEQLAAAQDKLASLLQIVEDFQIHIEPFYKA